MALTVGGTKTNKQTNKQKNNNDNSNNNTQTSKLPPTCDSVVLQ